MDKKKKPWISSCSIHTWWGHLAIVVFNQTVLKVWFCVPHLCPRQSQLKCFVFHILVDVELKQFVHQLVNMEHIQLLSCKAFLCFTGYSFLTFYWSNWFRNSIQKQQLLSSFMVELIHKKLQVIGVKIVSFLFLLLLFFAGFMVISRSLCFFWWAFRIYRTQSSPVPLRTPLCLRTYISVDQSSFGVSVAVAAWLLRCQLLSWQEVESGAATAQAFSSFCLRVCVAVSPWDFGLLCVHIRRHVWEGHLHWL